MRTAIFFVITESVVAIMYRRFGTTRRIIPQGSIILETGPFKVGQSPFFWHLKLGPTGLFRNFVKN